MDVDMDKVELGFVVNLETLREVIKMLNIDGKRWWIASDPQDAAETGALTIGHGDPRCKDRLNAVYFRVPVVSCATPRYQRPRLVLLLDSSYVKPESPGFYVEDGIVMQDGIEDFISFWSPLKKALISQLQAGN
jgi:hypothetical protein